MLAWLAEGSMPRPIPLPTLMAVGLGGRDVDGYSLMWMAPESVMSLLCAPDAPDAKKKAALAALEHLRSENAATQQRVSEPTAAAVPKPEPKAMIII